MTREEIETALKAHKEKIKRLKSSHKLLGAILKVDERLVKFSQEHQLNYLWVKNRLKDIYEAFFIFNVNQFLEYLLQPDYEDSLRKLFKLLGQLKMIRYLETDVNGDNYLISELFSRYTELCDNYRLDSIEYSEKYAGIDDLTPHEAVGYYHSCHADDPMWSTKAYCDYYGLEHDDGFYIGTESDLE